jgi:hypothetical protein
MDNYHQHCLDENPCDGISTMKKMKAETLRVQWVQCCMHEHVFEKWRKPEDSSGYVSKSKLGKRELRKMFNVHREEISLGLTSRPIHGRMYCNLCAKVVDASTWRRHCRKLDEEREEDDKQQAEEDDTGRNKRIRCSSPAPRQARSCQYLQSKSG